MPPKNGIAGENHLSRNLEYTLCPAFFKPVLSLVCLLDQQISHTILFS